MEQDLVIPTYQSQASEENYEEKWQIYKSKTVCTGKLWSRTW